MGGVTMSISAYNGRVKKFTNISFTPPNEIDEPLSKEMGFRLKEFPLGVATSSGQFSHAFSFGDAEAVTIFAVDAGVADAAATAVANLIKGDDVQGVIRQAIDKALSIDGVKGAFILYRGVVGKAGQIPELIKVNPP